MVAPLAKPGPLQKQFVFVQGSCRVLKKLKKVQSRLTEHQERVVGFERGGRRSTFAFREEFDLLSGPDFVISMRSFERTV